MRYSNSTLVLNLFSTVAKNYLRIRRICHLSFRGGKTLNFKKNSIPLFSSMRHEWLCTHDPDGSSSICNLSHPLQKLIRHMVFRSRFLHPFIFERPLLVKVQPQENAISLFKFILIVVLVLLGFYTIMGQSENLLNLLKYLLSFLQEILNCYHLI